VCDAGTSERRVNVHTRSVAVAEKPPGLLFDVFLLSVYQNFIIQFLC
jgi:hypothetical protein